MSRTINPSLAPVPGSIKSQMHIGDFSLGFMEEYEDLLNPYSELSLFLFRKVKEAIKVFSLSNHWNQSVETSLFDFISPDFKTSFPKYHLNKGMIKKAFEKVSFYLQFLEQHPESFTKEGKLNLNSLIKENLKQVWAYKHPDELHPAHISHSIAAKVSECIAVVEGTKPSLEKLTHKVWAMQKHLIKNYDFSSSHNPYDKCDSLDQLIIKTLIESFTYSPELSLEQIEAKTKQVLLGYKDAFAHHTKEEIGALIKSSLASKLYASSSHHLFFSSSQYKALSSFIKKIFLLFKDARPNKSLQECVKLIEDLYISALQAEKTISVETIKKAFSGNAFLELPASLISFYSKYFSISTSLASTLKKKTAEAVSIFKEIKKLPKTPLEWIEVSIWKHLSDQFTPCNEALFQKIEERSIISIIEDPLTSFSKAASEITRELYSLAEVFVKTDIHKWEHRIHMFAIQGEMVLQNFHMKAKSELALAIDSYINSRYSSLDDVKPSEVIAAVCYDQTKKHSLLMAYMPQVIAHVSLLYKYLWYTKYASKQESSFERFIKWYYLQVKEVVAPYHEATIISQIDQICKKRLPLLPFDAKHYKHLFRVSEKKIEAIC